MEINVNSSDKHLIRAYITGNDQAFKFLMNRHKDRIYTSIYLFVNDMSLANDIFQDVFIKIINTFRSGNYNEEGKFIQWALRIARNMCVDTYRKQKRNKTVSPTDDFDIFDVIPDNSSNKENTLIKTQMQRKVHQIINTLPKEQKEVIMLRHFAELSFKEIAELTNVSINTALGRMRYALINLRKVIEEHKISIY